MTSESDYAASRTPTGSAPKFEAWGREFFALTAAVVTSGLVLQLVLAARNDEGSFASVAGRIVNTLSFFTIQSNILVAITTAMLAVRLVRTSTAFRVARLAAVIAIAITGVVFHLALSDLHELTDKAAAADWILHTASPILCVVGWLVFGPRGQVTRRVVGLCATFPLLWLGYTLIRGEIVDDRFGRPYYPYPFLDVGDLGYGTVAVNIVIVAALFTVLALLALVVDRRLPRAPGLGDR